jgi:hypothetical protein
MYSEECLHLRYALVWLLREDLERHALFKQHCGGVGRLLAEDRMATAGRFEVDTLQLVKKAITKRAQVVNDASNGDDSGADGSSKRVRFCRTDTVIESARRRKSGHSKGGSGGGASLVACSLTIKVEEDGTAGRIE